MGGIHKRKKLQCSCGVICDKKQLETVNKVSCPFLGLPNTTTTLRFVLQQEASYKNFSYILTQVFV